VLDFLIPPAYSIVSTSLSHPNEPLPPFYALDFIIFPIRKILLSTNISLITKLMQLATLESIYTSVVQGEEYCRWWSLTHADLSIGIQDIEPGKKERDIIRARHKYSPRPKVNQPKLWSEGRSAHEYQENLLSAPPVFWSSHGLPLRLARLSSSVAQQANTSCNTQISSALCRYHDYMDIGAAPASEVGSDTQFRTPPPQRCSRPSYTSTTSETAQPTSLVKNGGDSRSEGNRDVMAVCNLLSS